MKRLSLAILIFAALALPAIAGAHFMVLHPSTSMALDKGASKLTVDLHFGHPFAQKLMDMAPPSQFAVYFGGNKIDLRNELKEKKEGDFRTHAAKYTFKRPGDHIFYVEPAPYWEPAEGKFIIHYTKTIVNGFAVEEGWDELVGAPIEIRPLTRPYGLWTGNLFTGQVLLNGKPLPNAEIEVAYNNLGSEVTSDADAFHIQVLKADENGVFSYAMPRAGWWGFAALAEAENTLEDPEGKQRPVEIGGLIWVYCQDMK
jgi:nickel transport protein